MASQHLHSPNTPLVAVLGPTGSGKSDLACALAQAFGGEIVNFDSIQVYRGLDVGSAKASPAQRDAIPHHLLDILDPAEELTAGAFARRARTVLREISARERLPLLAGGTGFYLRALLDGLSPAPPRDESLRAGLAQRSPAALHRFLRRYDPALAGKIHPNDSQKLIRAVEMTVLGGKPASQTQAAARDGLQGYAVTKIGLAPARSHLRARLNQRCWWMFQNGLLEEASALLAEGIPPKTKSLQSLGYKQAVAHLVGDLSLEAAVAECQLKTSQYAKRQMTWFRAERDVYWFPGFGSDEAVRQGAFDVLRKLLSPTESP